MTVCLRRECTEPADGRYCSDVCARIVATCAVFDERQWDAVMGRGAAVRHAFSWLDVRCPS